MRYILKYLLLSTSIFLLISCNATKVTKKEELNSTKVQENNTSVIIEKTKIKTKIKTEKEILEEELNHYFNALSTFNTDLVVEMTYPKLFDVIDPNSYRQYITSMMNSRDIKVSAYETSISKLSPITTFSNARKFAQVEYASKITIHFLNTNLYNTDEKINFLYDSLIYKYGQENIHIDIKARLLSIQKEEKLLAIKEPESLVWKFVGDNSRYRQLYPSFIPPEILEFIYQ